MFSIFIRIICFCGGVVSFYFLSEPFNRMFDPSAPVSRYNRAGFLLAGFLFGLLIAPYIEKSIIKLHKQVLRSMMRFSPHSLREISRPSAGHGRCLLALLMVWRIDDGTNPPQETSSFSQRQNRSGVQCPCRNDRSPGTTSPEPESLTGPYAYRSYTLFLARVPAAFHQTSDQRGLLEEKDRRQPDPRPPRHPHPPPARLEGRSCLGTRTRSTE